MAQSIIANRLTDGLVVFFVAAGDWTVDVDSAGVFEDEAAAQRAFEAARADETACLVIDPNLIDVTIKAGRVRPTAIREAIRAFGPTPEARTDSPKSAQA